MPMVGDGNCLFRALAWPEPERHAQVRAAVVAHLRAHWQSTYGGFCTEPRDAYCARMACAGVWGGEPELRAFADLARAAVHVHGVDGRLLARYGADDASRVHRVRFTGSHYDALA